MTHQIPFKTSELPSEIETYLDYVLDLADDNEVSVILTKERHVSADGTLVNGYFHGDDQELHVAVGQPINDWFSIFVHESQHMQQWIEDTPIWNATQITKDHDAEDIIFLWLGGLIELNQDQINRYINASRNVELDCEKRTAKQIMNFDLPIDLEKYVQRANAYVYFYTAMKSTRKWYTIGKEPYNTESIWKHLPPHFNLDYDAIPTIVASEYVRICQYS